MLRLGPSATRGSATVEQVGVVLLLAATFAGLVAACLAGLVEPPGHGLGIRIANRIACGPREPGVCRQHPAVSAYGWDVARAVRWLAPEPTARNGPGGEAVGPVDFRYCQRPSCAVPAGEAGLTTANRRLTLFTEVRRLGSAESGAGRTTWEIAYWFYRPSLGWQRVVRRAGPAEIEAASGTRLLLEDSPRLVPLEILPGRNHYDLPPGDEPPWRWKVKPTYDGWSA
ncbi:MAG: hypothetical protein J0H66_14630 [Solirubrobacterales bacterium]|nr:hypothetical protein [Solirubrobacterales bacterium]OJU95652.1 MAG: hypothetical protein BGO23_08565 [Solirubrobacterales bacterium 67-14]